MRFFAILVAVLGTAAASHASPLIIDRHVALTFNVERDFDGAISGSTVVFTEQNFTPELDVLIAFDTSVEAFNANAGNQFAADIDGDNVVYIDSSSGTPHVILHPIGGEPRQITLGGPNRQPAISGDTVVWVERTTDFLSDIFYFDGTFTQRLTPQSGRIEALSIDGNLVAWQQTEIGITNIYAAELGGVPFAVERGPQFASNPSVSGANIAYRLEDAVVVANVSTGSKRIVVSGADIRSHVVLDGDRVYWSEQRSGAINIFVYDLATGTEYPLTNSPEPSIINDADGNRIVYERTSSITDTRSTTNIWTLTYHINTPPIADAGADQSVAVGDTVLLQGSGHDVDGDSIAEFHWQFELRPDGSTAVLSDPTVADPTFVADVAGAYTLSLIVSDGHEESAPDAVTITAEADAPPVAVAIAEPQRGIAPLTVQFDGSGSHDAGGDPLHFRWDFGDGSSPSNAVSPSHTYSEVGTFGAVLTVTDPAGQSDSESVTIVVDPPNVPPTVSPNATPPTGAAPLEVQFSAGATDPEGDPLTYLWNFGDSASPDNSSTEENPVHVYHDPGLYVVWLTVSDGHSDVSASLLVSVDPSIEFSVSHTTLKFKERQPNIARITLRADLKAEKPDPDDIVALRMDGATIFELPFSSFSSRGDDRFAARVGRLAAVLDFANNTLFVAHSGANLAGLDATNGIAVEFQLEEDAAVDTIVPTEFLDGRHLIYVR